jgi:hypothetical protein
LGSSGDDAIGRVVRMPWRGSRMRPETKLDAALEGYDVS